MTPLSRRSTAQLITEAERLEAKIAAARDAQDRNALLGLFVEIEAVLAGRAIPTR